jgi:histidine triad (HIT) family protein
LQHQNSYSFALAKTLSATCSLVTLPFAHAGAEDKELLGELLLAAAEVARQEGLEEGGYRIVANTGLNGGQTVFHLHLHVIGGRSCSWPPG